MEHDRDWRELVRGDDLEQVAAIATSIEAMEYEVRVIDLAAGAAHRDGDSLPEIEPSSAGPFAVLAHAEEWGELTEVLDEIVAEQTTFDDSLETCDSHACHARRFVLIAMIAVIVLFVLVRILKG